MGLPRSVYVQEGQEGVYHCFGRCVRRAFLSGFDVLTGRDFSHRKGWLVDRLRHLAGIFAIDVCAYAIMENHYHTIVRTRPDIVAGWSDREVAIRWLTLFPRHRKGKGSPSLATEKEICALADCPERIVQLRKRLSSLSWFIGRLNEFIARTANKEDRVKGRFWEARFKCQALVDEAAIAACMVYVDLNPIRAGLAGTPEESDFTSIQERIRAWQKGVMTTASFRSEAKQDMRYGSLDSNRPPLEIAGEFSPAVPKSIATALSASWLCPIQTASNRRGVLQMTQSEYFDLVDKSGRITRSDKRGAMDADLAPILLRIGANPDAWQETVTCFGSRFRLAAGLLANLRSFAHQLKRHWLKGGAAARTAFTTSSPHWA
jgi:REP element-mobilizing transposase RayT